MNYSIINPIIILFEMFFSFFFAFSEMFFIQYMCKKSVKIQHRFFVFTLLLFILNLVNNVICYNLLSLLTISMVVSIVINTCIPLIYLSLEFKRIDRVLMFILPSLFQSVYIMAFLFHSLLN